MLRATSCLNKSKEVAKRERKVQAPVKVRCLSTSGDATDCE